MLVAATFALGGEFAPWRKLRRFQSSTDGPVPIHQAKVGDVRLRVVVTGVGERAASCALPAIFDEPPDVCIASGLAGGLDESLEVGDIIAAGSVRDASGVSLESDPRLLALALRRGAAAIDLFSSALVIIRAEEKRRMSAFGDAVDMESAAVLGESDRLGIPCIAIRAISDSAATDVPIDFNRTLTGDGRVSPARMMAELATRPGAVPGLVRLGLDGRRAASALVAFLDAYVGQLAEGAR